MRRMSLFALVLANVLWLSNQAPALVYDDDFEFLRGDVNSSGEVDLSDVLSLVAFQFYGGPAPECDDAADVDDNGRVDTIDVFQLLYSHMGYAAPPPSPGRDLCGLDPTSDSLGCANSACAPLLPSGF